MVSDMTLAKEDARTGLTKFLQGAASHPESRRRIASDGPLESRGGFVRRQRRLLIKRRRPALKTAPDFLKIPVAELGLRQTAAEHDETRIEFAALIAKGKPQHLSLLAKNL